MVGLFKQPKRHLKKLVRDGEYTEAITFGKNLESDYSDDSDFMFIMGSIYFIVDEPTKALAYFEKSFQLNSDDIEMLTLKTNVHLKLQQKDEAMDCCKRIIKLEPKNSEAKSLLDQLENI
ncbi:MAG: tetratricopeptide repeat protein [Candidatus Nitrosopumilus limneticus]|nr:C component of TonB system [Candidatus Nitrosopumilus limneticus]MDA0668733.1 tetratricopeptide repeat protein [Thermoproteota archaeon]HJJ20711.1 tetratricopeptide repeat protein [Nitrosopumilus sp.]MDA0853519.1 tetratricopeptide repeat protein [Thermoproteota archaeon]MDA1123778.1 tetratricopeptide repeat protein [Thermoproteota archaeon]